MAGWIPRRIGSETVSPALRGEEGAEVRLESPPAKESPGRHRRDGRGVWYLIGYHDDVDAASTIRVARERAELSLRQLGRIAGTSHSTLAAYEHGAKVPTVTTLARIVRAAGFGLELELSPRAGGGDRLTRGRELAEVLELAAHFPARHEHALDLPRFGRGV